MKIESKQLMKEEVKCYIEEDNRYTKMETETENDK